jgi:hypothetical protein
MNAWRSSASSARSRGVFAAEKRVEQITGDLHRFLTADT